MKQNKPESGDMRKFAEEKARRQEHLTLEYITSLSAEDIMGRLHDLAVHQIELEVQNEELRNTQFALDAARERYFDLYDLAPVGYLRVSEGGIVKECNLTAGTILGFNRNEISDKPITRLIQKASQDVYYLHFNKIIKTLITNSFELQMTKKNGNPIWARFRMSVTTSESDKREYRVVFEDISELKKADAEREKWNDQLVHFQKLESLGLIAGGIAHDFNNLLSGIFASIELAHMKTKDENVSSYLEKSLSNINRARALTQKLLTFSHGGDPIKQKCYLDPFIQDTVLFALSGSGVSCHFQIENDLQPCDFDKNQIGQVLDNLTINAWQSMPNGGVIEVSAQNILLASKEHNSLSEGHYVKISIKDQGSGIPKELQSIIFEPYYTTKYMGHGLGLSICYSIINRHGGCISVDSDPGKSSQFDVYLPACMELIPPPVVNSVQDHKGEGTFLVMDDESIICETMSGVLESWGYNVVTTVNGEDTLKFLIQEFSADRKLAGIILDLTIPGGLGGRDIICEIRKIDNTVPIFITSGYSEDPVMSYPAKFGFTASIRKPFKISELIDMLETYILTE